MKAAICQRARELGFDDCRVTAADPPESAPHFQRWLASGQQGEMGYLERNSRKRVDPQQVLAGAGSIITLAISYEKGEDSRQEAARSETSHSAIGTPYFERFGLARPTRQPRRWLGRHPAQSQQHQHYRALLGGVWRRARGG